MSRALLTTQPELFAPVIARPDGTADDQWLPITGDTPRCVTLTVRAGACVWSASTWDGKHWHSTVCGRREEVFPTHWRRPNEPTGKEPN